LVPKWKYSFYFWNEFRSLVPVHFNPQKSPPWKLKSPPKSGKSQNRPLNALNRPLVGDFAHAEYYLSKVMYVSCKESKKREKKIDPF